MDVPLNAPYPSLVVWRAELISCPGARMFTHSPMLLKLASPSVSVVAPTVIANRELAGESSQASVPSLPAAATTWMPSSTNSSTQSLRNWLKGPPRDMLTTEGSL